MTSDQDESHRRPAPEWPEPKGEGKKSPARKKPAEGPPQLICAAEVEAKPVYWLWRPYIPQGMLTLLEGDPGLGKSWLTMEITARMTRGEALPGSISLPPRKVLVMNSEDSREHTLVPRLEALGADMNNVFFADRVFPLDAEGVRLMEGLLQEVSAGIVFIDPLVAYLGSKVDMHRANEVRPVMAALAEVAEKSGASVIGVRHLRKGSADSKEIYGGLGSIDFSASARSILLLDRSGMDEEVRVLRHIKNNVGKLGEPLAFRYAEFEADGPNGPVTGQRFEWIEGWEEPTAEPKGPQVSKTPRFSRAKQFIEDFLANGPRLATEVYEAAEANGLKPRTLKKAKKGVARSYREEDQWYWELEEEGDPEAAAPPDAFLDPKVLEEAQARLARSKTPRGVAQGTPGAV